MIDSLEAFSTISQTPSPSPLPTKQQPKQCTNETIGLPFACDRVVDSVAVPADMERIDASVVEPTMVDRWQPQPQQQLGFVTQPALQ